MQSVLSVANLKKSFRRDFWAPKVDALKGVSFDVEPGKITGFLGANGAGKTTTFKCIFQLAHPDEGQVSFFGGKPLNREVKSQIGFLPERPYFYEYLTGEEFLIFYATLSERLTRKDIKTNAQKLLDRVGLAHASKRLLRSYSKGMLQRIGIAQALVHNPKFVVFDEPMSGLDPDGRFEVQKIIEETAQAGTAVFFSSHLLHDAEKICENLVILKQGDMIYQGKTAELIARASAGYTVTYHTGSRPEVAKAASATDLQNLIDRLRREKATIVEVGADTKTLEEIFVEMAIKPTKGKT